MKTPQNFDELSTCLHELVDFGVFMHFGEPDEVHDLVEDVLDLLEDVYAGESMTPVEAATVQSFILTVEVFLDKDEDDNSDQI